MLDSKMMTPERRYLFASSMLDTYSDQFGWLLSIMGPDKISEGMLREYMHMKGDMILREKYNLNEMSYDVVFELLRRANEHLKQIEHVHSMVMHLSCPHL